MANKSFIYNSAELYIMALSVGKNKYGFPKKKVHQFGQNHLSLVLASERKEDGCGISR